jgi:hypothetical protein
MVMENEPRSREQSRDPFADLHDLFIQQINDRSKMHRAER